MKIAHITDLHVQAAPRLGEMTGKRLLGTANLYVLGRRTKFSLAAQEAAVASVVEEEPDVVVFTGDLTAQALDAEFSRARVLLDPILSRFPTVMIAGNHDTYVREETPGDRMRELFGEWMGTGMPALHVYGDVAFICIETCRCHPLSSGWTPEEQLVEAGALLQDLEDKFTFMCIHYPLLGRRGEPYGPSTRALANGDQVRKWVNTTPGINAIVHGHEHHGFTTDISGPNGPVTILNPGASGYAHLPDQNRTSHLCFYTIDDGKLTGMERLLFDGTSFNREPGGAFSSGR
ncbi:MAG: metallophosphoesterase family protein [Myxococcota bacterium]